MGLDMYIYKASKPELMFGIYPENDDYIKTLLLIPKDEYKDERVSALKPFMVRIQLEANEYDFEKIKKDYGVKDDIYLSGFSMGEVVFSSHNERTIPIPIDIIEKHYLKKTLKTVYAVELTEKYYWRKAYDVQDTIHSHLDTEIENCGYYLLDDDTADAIENIDNAFDTDIVKKQTEPCIFYHEWY